MKADLNSWTSMLGNKRQKKVFKPAWYGISKCRHFNDSQKTYQFSNKSLAFFLPQLTRKAFNNFGFSTATLILDWPQIIGADIASWTAPEEIKWPKKQHSSSAKEGLRPSEAVLMLRVDPAHALEATYSARQIIDRINRYFGYRAISDVRFLSAPLNPLRLAPQNSAKPASVREEPAQRVAPFQDPLKEALFQLEKHLIKARGGQKT